MLEDSPSLTLPAGDYVARVTYDYGNNTSVRLDAIQFVPIRVPVQPSTWSALKALY
ncbi:MAG: hypothetical protein GY835_07285 [bacterium]|nr:hypothetical protein [bacterium]